MTPRGERRRQSVYLIHGFRVPKPEASIGVLAPHFKSFGYEVHTINYGFLWWPWTEHRTRKAAENLANDIAPDSLVVAHSNGCLLEHYLSRVPGVASHRAIYVQPALENDMEPGPSVEFLRVCWNPHDLVVRLARFLPGSPWGQMGRTGFIPNRGLGRPDERIVNVEIGRGHSPYRESPRHFALGCHHFHQLSAAALREMAARQWAA